MVGKNIKKAREEKGFTQDALAEQLNVTRQAVSNWENEKTQPDIGMLQKIASALLTTTDQLIDEAGRQRDVRSDGSGTELLVPENFCELKKIKEILNAGKSVVLKLDNLDQLIFDYMKNEIILTPENHRCVDQHKGEEGSFFYLIMPIRQTGSELGFNGIEIPSFKAIDDLRSVKTLLENDGKVVVVELNQSDDVVLDYMRKESIVTAASDIQNIGKHCFFITP
ncbi:MAG: helix-turn-helix transcriptional regulator [Clostridia bacterium]|nr:helix-turn-helix transcriptional regulator [Clostridia bacterium]